MRPDKWRMVIEPNGTTATAYLIQTGDYDNLQTYELWVKFSDPLLNFDKDDGWYTSALVNVTYYRNGSDSFTDDKVLELEKSARQFYDYFLSLRTSYSLEDTINEWRRRYEEEKVNSDGMNYHVEKLSSLVKTLEARVNELETDYVKGLEDTIRHLKNVLRAIIREHNSMVNELQIEMDKL